MFITNLLFSVRVPSFVDWLRQYLTFSNQVFVRARGQELKRDAALRPFYFSTIVLVLSEAVLVLGSGDEASKRFAINCPAYLVRSLALIQVGARVPGCALSTSTIERITTAAMWE